MEIDTRALDGLRSFKVVPNFPVLFLILLLLIAVSVVDEAYLLVPKFQYVLVVYFGFSEVLKCSSNRFEAIFILELDFDLFLVHHISLGVFYNEKNPRIRRSSLEFSYL